MHFKPVFPYAYISQTSSYFSNLLCLILTPHTYEHDITTKSEIYHLYSNTLFSSRHTNMTSKKSNIVHILTPYALYLQSLIYDEPFQQSACLLSGVANHAVCRMSEIFISTFGIHTTFSRVSDCDVYVGIYMYILTLYVP